MAGSEVLNTLVRRGNARLWKMSVRNTVEIIEPKKATRIPELKPSPCQPVTVGRAISWSVTASPPTATVSKPTGPAANSPSPYVTLKLAVENGRKVLDAAVSKPAEPNAHVDCGAGFPERSKQL